MCVQNKRPLTTSTYDYDPDSFDIVRGVLQHKMNMNAAWFRALKILLSITNILVIPLTSTVCASVAVIYIQNYGRARRFSMQHTSTLADEGWTSPRVWLALLSSKGRKSTGSQFLVFAIAFHALGMYLA